MPTTRALASRSDFSAAKANEPMSVPFTDARSCKDWLKSIPLTNAGLAQRQILEAVRALNRAAFNPLERLTSMELMRDKVAFVQMEQRVKYTGKTVPLAAAEMQVWEISRALVEEMEAAYRKCFSEVAAGAQDIEPHVALIIQRTMRYIGLQMLFPGLIYRRFDPALWMRLHLQWIEAESRGLTLVKVKDSVGSIDGVSSVAGAYVAILLAQLANTYELSARQIDFVDAVLKRFAAKVEFGLQPIPSRTGQLLTVDLFNNAGVVSDPDARPGDHIRFLDATALSKSLRARIAKLQEGEAPANLNLPPDWSAGDTLVQLNRLHQLWCEGDAPRGSGVVPEETEAVLSFGLADAHHALSGKLFEQPGRRRELSRQELNDITMFGKVSEQTMKSLYGDSKPKTETWGIIDEALGNLRLMRPGSSEQGLAIGRLIGVRLGGKGNLLVGWVSGIAQEGDGLYYATLSLFPGVPTAIAVRSADLRNRPSSQYTQGFLLPAVEPLNVPQTLIFPAGLVAPGRGVDQAASAEAPVREVTVFEYLERGIDFDRVTYF